jgi:predicted sugar kinase
MALLYHISVLATNETYSGMFLMGMFVCVIYSKIYAFNSFFKEIHELLERHKKNPEVTEREFLEQ